MEPFFLSYLLIPLGYTSALAALSASAERALVRGHPEKAIKLLTIARKAPFLSTYRSMCDVNLITAAYAVEDFDLVEKVWAELLPKLESLRPYAGSALASYGATLIGRGHYLEAEVVLRNPVRDPRPDQRADGVTVLCIAFCQANLASALLNQGRLAEAQETLFEAQDAIERSPLLESLTVFLQSYLSYLEGFIELSRDFAINVDFKNLPLLYRTELRYHYATLLARCDDPESAERVIAAVEWDTSSHRKLTRLRCLAKAEIASCRGDTRTAISYYRDLKSLQYRGALSYLRAAALAQRTGEERLHIEFLRVAVELDPESHWAQVARKKLSQIEGIY